MPAVHLNGMAAAIRDVYDPGARVSIVSDGLIYNDILGVDDEQVWEYREALRQLARENNLDNLEFLRQHHLFNAESTSKEEYLRNALGPPERSNADPMAFGPRSSFVERDRPSYFREKFDLFNWPGLNLRFKYLCPTGILISARDHDQSYSFQDVPILKIRRLAKDLQDKFAFNKISIGNRPQWYIRLLTDMLYDRRVTLWFAWSVGDVIVSDNLTTLQSYCV
ncbi:hypothetical protein CDD80_7328 [Ophiocordyceps camponoti-rufipedis]|uniref:TauD/TfdA-like domain-containing protein n=1 Tax=Ophiocordyceps camponoti-rufipedis TaxID=2004952 RepID=A0A2C5ZFF0_9HYPO|nr:hypothetical protein CDD80_7328 [Ophiocordyceps camponoti-rufipedis]